MLRTVLSHGHDLNFNDADDEYLLGGHAHAPFPHEHARDNAIQNKIDQSYRGNAHDGHHHVGANARVSCAHVDACAHVLHG